MILLMCEILLMCNVKILMCNDNDNVILMKKYYY